MLCVSSFFIILIFEIQLFYSSREGIFIFGDFTSMKDKAL